MCGIGFQCGWQVRSYFWMERSKLLLFVLICNKHGFLRNDPFWIKHEHKPLEIMIVKDLLWLHCSQDVEMLRLTWITQASSSTRNFGWDLLHPSGEKKLALAFLTLQYRQSFKSIEYQAMCGQVKASENYWIDLLILKPSLAITQCLQWGLYSNCIAHCM